MRLEPIRSDQLRDLLLGTFLQDGTGTHGGTTGEEVADLMTVDQVVGVTEVQEADQGEVEMAEEEEEAEAARED
jgi:hypothetical protein